MRRDNRIPIVGAIVNGRNEHGFLTLTLNKYKLTDIATTIGITDGYDRLLLDSDTTKIIHTFDNKNIEITYKEKQIELLQVTDLASYNSYLVFNEEFTPAQSLEKCVANTDNIQLCATDSNEFFNDIINQKNNTYFIIDSIISEEELYKTLINVVKEQIKLGKITIYDILYNEAKNVFNSNNFTDIRSILKTKFNDIYTPIKSAKELSSFIANNTDKILKRIDKINCIYILNTIIQFVHEETVKKCFNYTGKLEEGTFLEFKYKNKSSGVFLSIKDSYFSFQEESFQTSFNIAILPESSNKEFNLSIVPKRSGTIEIQNITTFIQYIASKFNLDTFSPTRIRNIPSNKVQDIVDFIYDLAYNTKDNSNIISMVNNKVDTDVELTDDEIKLLPSDLPVIENNEYDNRQITIQVLKLQDTTQQFEDWHNKYITSNIQLCNSTDINNQIGTNELRSIVIKVDQYSGYYNPSNALKATAIKEILKGFKIVGKDLSLPKLLPKAPLNSSIELKTTALSHCLQELLNIIEEPLKDFLLRMVSYEGKIMPFVCEVNNNTSSLYYEWDFNESPFPKIGSYCLYMSKLSTIFSKLYKKEDNLLLSLEKSANSNISRYDLLLALITGVINRYMYNGTIITEDLKLNKFRSEGEAMASSICNRRKSLLLNGYTPITLENII